jgi:hypothetical protein
MSYILGALKKADQERRRSSETRLADWDQDEWDDPTPKDYTIRWLIGIVLVGLALVLSIFGFVAFRVLETVPQNSAMSIEQNRPVTQLPESEAEVSSYPDNDVQAGLPMEKLEEGIAQSGMSGQDMGEEESSGSAEALPDFSGHLYFPGNPGLSRVFANASSYTEGELIDGYRIEQIGEQAVLLSKDGEQVRINLRN